MIFVSVKLERYATALQTFIKNLFWVMAVHTSYQKYQIYITNLLMFTKTHKWWCLLCIKIETIHLKLYLQTDFSWEVPKIFKRDMKCDLVITLGLKMNGTPTFLIRKFFKAHARSLQKKRNMELEESGLHKAHLWILCL